MSFDWVIKNGHIVNADADFTADIGISNGRIAALGADLHGDREIDAAGKLVTPGAIDGHVHLQMTLPGDITTADTFQTGTRAAAFGGTTAVVDFVECAPDEPMLDALARRRAQADPQVMIDYGLHMTIAPPEIDKLSQVQDVIDAGCASFKLYMAYGFYLDDGQLLQALQTIGAQGGLPVIHAENWHAIQTLVAQHLAAGHTAPAYHPKTRPAALEAEAAGRAIDLATYAESPLHIFHVGCNAVVERITAARARGLHVTGETCPQYLALTDDLYQQTGVGGALPVCAPPLRSAADREAMWHALAADQLQIVTTDHCPFTIEQKQHGLDANDFSQIPGGVPSIEVRFPLVYSLGVGRGHLTKRQWVNTCCTRPAQLFGFQNKGVIAPGYDADLVVFDPHAEWTVSTDTLHENCDWTPYNALELRGRPQTTFVRGEPVVQDGELVGQPGQGRFIEREIG